MTWLPKSVVCLRYYDRFRFRSDLLASSVLALQVLPVSIAIAVASGLSPFYGVSCAAVASFVASAFGDSKVRICAPSILFIPAVSTIVTRHSVLGLSLSTLIAGLLLVFFGAIGLGRAVQMLPRPVILGLYSGIALLLAITELPALLGSSQNLADDQGWKSLTVLGHSGSWEPAAIILGLMSLGVIAVSGKRLRRIPVALIVMGAGMLLGRVGHFPFRDLPVSNPTPIAFHPMLFLGPDLLGGVLSQSFAIAVLVAIESVRAIDLASEHTAEHAEANGELVVEGGVNLAAAFAGGLPACGISSFSSENALLGAQTPVAGILQSGFLVGFFLLFAPFLPFVPQPVIAALILSAVCRLTYWGELRQVFKSGGAELAGWFAISVMTFVDLAIGVTVGLLIGMFLHLRKQKRVRLGQML